MGSSPPNKTEREYGRRLYVSPKKYQDQIDLLTDKAQDIANPIPHSENKKPYLEDSYEEMEYFASPPFGFSWDWPDFDFPFVPDRGDSYYPPWLLVFTCQAQAGSCFCEGEERCYSLNCSHEVVGVEINEFLTTNPGHFSVSISAGQICITAKDGADPVVYIDITMVAFPGDGSKVYGTYEGLSITSCPEDDCGCAGVTELLYDNDSSSDIVYQTGTRNVYVTGGQGPYNWTIDGSGLSMASAQTATGANQVNATGAACGSGAITITDACGQVTYGFIRVVEDSQFSAWGDYDVELFTPCEPGGDWSSNSGNTYCDDPIFQYYASWGGEFYSGNCPQSCRCENYHIYASTGPPDTTRWDLGGGYHGCDHTCTYQAGARALRACRIRVREWECS